jgi:hypothetical protein
MSVYMVTVPGCKHARLDMQDTRMLLKEPSGRWGYDVQDLLDDDQDPVGRDLPPNVQVLSSQIVCMFFSGPLLFFQEAWLLMDENAL